MKTTSLLAYAMPAVPWLAIVGITLIITLILYRFWLERSAKHRALKMLRTTHACLLGDYSRIQSLQGEDNEESDDSVNALLTARRILRASLSSGDLIQDDSGPYIVRHPIVALDEEKKSGVYFAVQSRISQELEWHNRYAGNIADAVWLGRVVGFYAQSIEVGENEKTTKTPKATASAKLDLIIMGLDELITSCNDKIYSSPSEAANLLNALRD